MPSVKGHRPCSRRAPAVLTPSITGRDQTSRWEWPRRKSADQTARNGRDDTRRHDRILTGVKRSGVKPPQPDRERGLEAFGFPACRARFAISSGRFGCGDAGHLTDASSAAGAIRRVACRLEFEVGGDVALALQIAPARTAGDLLEERLDVTVDGRETGLPVTELATDRAGRIHVLRGAAGVLAISYAATIRPVMIPVAPVATDDVVVDAEAIGALRQSRYCPSDAMTGFAAVELADSHGPDLARATASWVFERLAYQPGWSGPFDTAVDTLLAGAGTCRDFAHLTISLCRALGVPARFVAVYAPGISPMDFHAVVEARRGSGWEVLDPARLAPRSSLVRIATGRDAADTAFATTLRGQAELTSYEISTVLDGDLPPDDHRTVTALA